MFCHAAALMQDQVAGLKSRGVVATYVSSDRTAAERSMIMRCLEHDLDVKKLPPCDKPNLANAFKSEIGLDARADLDSSYLQMLYVTPESLATDKCVVAMPMYLRAPCIIIIMYCYGERLAHFNTY